MIVNRTVSEAWYETGVVLFFTVVDSDNQTLVVRTAATESPSSSGVYVGNVPAWDTAWAGRIIWDDGTTYDSIDFLPMTSLLPGTVSGETVNTFEEVVNSVSGN